MQISDREATISMTASSEWEPQPGMRTTIATVKEISQHLKEIRSVAKNSLRIPKVWSKADDYNEFLTDYIWLFAEWVRRMDCRMDTPHNNIDYRLVNRLFRTNFDIFYPLTVNCDRWKLIKKPEKLIYQISSYPYSANSRYFTNCTIKFLMFQYFQLFFFFFFFHFTT